MINQIPVLEARNLNVIRGGKNIIKIPSLCFYEGEIFYIIGPNGAGKSTLIQTLCTLLKSSNAEILYKGKIIGKDISILEFRRKCAMVFQEPLLFDTTVYKNVASGLKIRGLKKKEIESTVIKSLERFGILHCKDRSAKTLSGGEARRVSIARAYAISPEILFLDEPFSALDPVIRDSLVEDLYQALRAIRTTTIFVTHDRTDALRLSDRIGVMKDGILLQTGSAAEVMQQPVNEFVATLTGIETILKGVVTKKADGILYISVSGILIEASGNAEINEKVTLCIRPENVILSINTENEKTSIRNSFKAKIEKVKSMGFYCRVLVNCGFLLTAYITNHSIALLSIKEGMDITASFKATSVHLIRNKI